MTTEEAICSYFSEIHLDGDQTRFSSFKALLRDARLATNRDLDSGQKALNADHGSWLGALAYMALLDQIGSCFRPLGTPKRKEPSILLTLGYFSNLQDDECKAIYALRCSFAHDYSLSNVRYKRKGDQLIQSLTHRFCVSQGANGPVVTLPAPSDRWDGKFTTIKNDRNLTHINLEKLGDLVEDVCKRVAQLAILNQLDISLDEGPAELFRKYSNFIAKQGD